MASKKLVKKINLDPATEYDQPPKVISDDERIGLESQAVADENKPVNEHIHRLVKMLNEESDESMKRLIQRRIERAKKAFVKNYDEIPE